MKKKKLAEHYAYIANNAENENEFYQSINSCLEVLEWMSQFEKYGVYKIFECPSDDIKKIKNGMPISIERFQNRMKESGIVTSEYDYMEGHDFEYFCAELLKKNGFSNVEVTQGSGDHGIDILAEKYGITFPDTPENLTLKQDWEYLKNEIVLQYTILSQYETLPVDNIGLELGRYE